MKDDFISVTCVVALATILGLVLGIMLASSALRTEAIHADVAEYDSKTKAFRWKPPAPPVVVTQTVDRVFLPELIFKQGALTNYVRCEPMKKESP